MGKKVTRLFEQFAPAHYKIHLDIDDEALTFRGTVTVKGAIKGRPRQRITLHQKDLTITSASVVHIDKKGNRSDMHVDRINTHAGYDEVRIHTKDMVYPGQAEVAIAFTGIITDTMHGIYPCYFNHDGKEKKLIATQFESHHAREAFPCVDEPEAKSVFDLTLTTDKSSLPTVLGNQPIAQQTTIDSKTTTIFESSPIMSSYLLAFVAGDMHAKQAQTKSGITIKTWATTAQAPETLDYALDVSVKCVEFFEDYFGVPYPLKKLDHVALPDFSSGAMENWGLITYRERLLVEYPGTTGHSTREHIALVIAHETSHQWFGNLVTMKWWDDLWLNESFANMMEYEAVDAIFPEWQIWDTFIAAEGLSAIRRDAVNGVQSVKTDVNHPDEISTLFDPSIVYAKGGRLLYMLKNYIGEEHFRAGLKHYFKQHAYKNTTGHDLWESMSSVSSKDVSAFMNAWLLRAGFPVVNVETANGKTTLSQKHFSYDPAATSDRLWPVPLFAEDPEAPILFNSKEITIPALSSPLINNGNIGHYIVSYKDTVSFEQIVTMLKEHKLNNSDALGLLNAQAMLGKAGYVSYTHVLDVVKHIADQTSEPIWDAAALVISELNRFIEIDPSLEKPVKQYVDELTRKQVQRLGWQEKPTDSTSDQKLRGIVLSLSSFAENHQTHKTTKDLFELFKKDQSAIPAELRSIVFAAVIKDHVNDSFNYLLELHHATDNSDLKADIASGVCSTKNSDELEILFTTLTNKKLVKPQDADRWLFQLVRGRFTKVRTWQWIRDNWSWIEATYGSDKSYDYMPRIVASTVNTEQMFAEFKNHFVPLEDPALKRNTDIGIEEITTRLPWLTSDLTNIKTYFDA